MRNYTLTLVFKANTNKEEVIQEITDTLAETGGKIDSQEELTQKKISYPIQKTLDGDFLQIVVTAASSWPAQINDLLRVSDHLLRFIITSGIATPKIITNKEEPK